MSTEYIAPMPISKFLAKARDLGWIEDPLEGSMRLRSPGGHYCHHVCETIGGETSFTRFGDNEAACDALAEAVGALSEDSHGNFLGEKYRLKPCQKEEAGMSNGG